MIKKSIKFGYLALALSALVFAGCQKEQLNTNSDPSAVAFSSDDDDHDNDGEEIEFYALANGVTLDLLSSDEDDVEKSVQITGLQGGETILAIDFRPATGQLYGVGSSSRIYVINPATGAARSISATPFTPAINGNIVALDFNPTVDRIRLITNNGQNLRLNPETGLVISVDGNINLAGQPTPMLAAAAYENNVAGATATVLYSIDLTSKSLYRNNPPNAGTLELVGSLNLNITGEGGYDIDAESGTGLAIFKVDGRTTLFSVNDETAATKVLAKYEKNYTAIAIPTNDVAFASTGTQLLIFNPDDKDFPIATKTFGGLNAGETVVGIDMRPLNGQLYALTSASRVLTVNSSNGATALVATLSTPLSGTDFGMDFNPTVDRIRIVSNNGQNLRFNPNAPNGTLVDASINPAGKAVTAVAYTNNFAGATTTVLYDIDAATDSLYIQNPPNNGTLVGVAKLGVNVEAMSGFDIGGTSDKGFALLQSGGITKLYKVDLKSSSNSKNDEALKFKRNFPSNITGFTLGLGF